MENYFIINEEKVIELYQSLNMSGYFPKIHLSFLKAVICYLSIKNIHITEKEIAKMVCGNIKITMRKLMEYEYTRSLLKDYFKAAYEKENWDQIMGMIDELYIKMGRKYL